MNELNIFDYLKETNQIRDQVCKKFNKHFTYKNPNTLKIFNSNVYTQNLTRYTNSERIKRKLLLCNDKEVLLEISKDIDNYINTNPL